MMTCTFRIKGGRAPDLCQMSSITLWLSTEHGMNVVDAFQICSECHAQMHLAGWCQHRLSAEIVEIEVILLLGGELVAHECWRRDVVEVVGCQVLDGQLVHRREELEDCRSGCNSGVQQSVVEPLVQKQNPLIRRRQSLSRGPMQL